MNLHPHPRPNVELRAHSNATGTQGISLQHTLANSFASPPLELILTFVRTGRSQLLCYFDEAGVRCCTARSISRVMVVRTKANSRKEGMESDGWCLAIGPSLASCAGILVAPCLVSWGVRSSRSTRGGLGGYRIRDTASDESQG